jgi:hypothetical protein
MVFPGNGDGTFGAARTSPFNATGTIVTGFFDGDANLDIAVAASSSVFVLLGNGDGTFRDAVAYPGSTNSSNTMRSGLFNADANLDLVETDFNGSIRVFLGNGDGTFAPGVSYGVTGAPVDLAVADFNGDGHADVVAALGGFDDSSFALFLGVGDGTFSAPTLVPAGGQPTSIAAADLDADGYADVALGVLPGIVILRGNGNGTFQAPIPYAVAGNRVAQLIALDLDGDGRLDLAALQPSSAASVMLEILQTPNRTFTVGPGYIAPSGFLAAGDLNADGLPDFALPGLNMPVMSVLVSTGVGSYLAARSVAPGLAPQFVGGVGDTINSAVLLNEDGTFRVASTLPDGAQFAVAAELTGDTNIDLFVSSFGAATLLIGHGDGTFTAAASFPLFGAGNGVVAADFNGDGIPDLAALSGGSNVSELNVLLGQGGGAFLPLPAASFNFPTSSIASGDLDGDGLPDLVIARVGFSGSQTIEVLIGNGDGTFHSVGTHFAGPEPFSLAIGDFNGDGNLDVIAADAGSTSAALLFGDGAGGLGPALLIDVGAAPVWLTIGDFDADGHLDFATANDASFSNASLSVLLGDGTGAFRSPILYTTGFEPTSVVAGAFGPDGGIGLATSASTDLAVEIFRNSALNVSPVAGAGTRIVGTGAALSVAVSGRTPLTYQWRKGGVPLSDGGAVSGSKTGVLRIDPVSFDDAGSYDVLVTDSCGSTGSNSAALSVEFADVPVSSPFHADILAVAAAGITAGCGGGNYCPAAPVRRDQMAVFLLKSEHGPAYVPPDCAGTFADVACPGSFTNWVEQLAAEGVTSGCGGGNYCPANSVTRAQMAVFLLKTSLGSGYVPPAATGVFNDVPVGAFAANFIEDLYNRAISGGCSASPLLYCPDNPVLRQQMATFLVRTFAP